MKKCDVTKGLAAMVAAAMVIGSVPYGVLADELPVTSVYTANSVSENAVAQAFSYYEPREGSNVNSQNYSVWASPVESYLVENGSGYLRFQANADENGYLAESYDAKFNCLGGVLIKKELPLFGGFYASDDAYYILTGQENKSESDSTEVYRVTKYDKSWNRLGTASLYGSNTYIPFAGGSARMAMEGSTLVVHTCHEMYQTADGYHHQANVTFAVDTFSMQILDERTDISNISSGYVSHSFNQFISLKNGVITTIDHGDAYPRSIVLVNYGSASISNWGGKSNMNVLDISGAEGDNATGVSVGGFLETDGRYLVAYNSIDQTSQSGTTRNIFLFSSDDTGAGATTQQVTKSSEGGQSYSTPQMVNLENGHVLLLWTDADASSWSWIGTDQENENTSKVYYEEVSVDGTPIGDIHTMAGALSDCQPILSHGKVSWYVWNGEHTTFYSIDASDVTKASSSKVFLFDDVKDAGKYFYSPVYWAYNSDVTRGITATKFGPFRPCTRAQVVSFLWRVYGSPAAGTATSFSDVKNDAYYAEAVNWAVANGITSGTKPGKFSPNAACTRAQFVTFLWKAAGSPSASSHASFTDVEAGKYYAEAVDWAVASGITSGTDATHFSPSAKCNRAQTVTFLSKVN